MTNAAYSKKLYDAVNNYFLYNPNTLMPLMMVTAALRGELHITESASKPQYTACSLAPAEMTYYDWVCLDDSLRPRVADWNRRGVKCVSVEFDMGRSLLEIYRILKRNDEEDVVREYYHRIGILNNHWSDKASKGAQRAYATLVFAEILLAAPARFLRNEFHLLFCRVLARSGVQPKRPRIGVARTLKALLGYDGKGLVYNPFAGCSIAGSLIRSKSNYYGDGDLNDKLYAAGMLLNCGMGVSNEHFIQRDSRQWLVGKKIDYLLSTYTGYVGGETCFDFCLGKCLDDETFTGRYAGMVAAREIFERQTPNFMRALKRDWVEAIVLLNFGEAAVLINANKREDARGRIRFVDEMSLLGGRAPMERRIVEDRYAKFISLPDALERGGLKSLVVKPLGEIPGYEKVHLCDLVERIPRKVYDVDDFDLEDRNMAYIERSEEYIGFDGWNENIGRRPVSNIFSPVYFLDRVSVVVNSYGDIEPRLFGSGFGHAFFDDGYAFALKESCDPIWLINELRETYVRRQLHPYGNNSMVPEVVSEEDYLNLVIYRQIDDEAEDDDMVEEDVYEGLDIGYVLRDDNKEYKILNYISNGSFGYTYRAEMKNCGSGATEIVAIKELFPKRILDCRRENNRVIVEDWALDEFESDKRMFRSEPEFIRLMNDVKDSHVTEVKSIFDYEPTGTLYYVMKYYAGETLKDMVNNSQVPSEDLVVEKIIIPMCKALHTMHTHNILHLDIKPDNIVIDDNGEAVLIDFGVALLYDENGNIVSCRESRSTSGFSAPENCGGRMKHFAPQSDIYGAAVTLLYLFTGGKFPQPEEGYGGSAYETMNCSEQMKRAVFEGMAQFANDRPSNAQQWLNMFPGCEDMKL